MERKLKILSVYPKEGAGRMFITCLTGLTPAVLCLNRRRRGSEKISRMRRIRRRFKHSWKKSKQRRQNLLHRKFSSQKGKYFFSANGLVLHIFDIIVIL